MGLYAYSVDIACMNKQLFTLRFVEELCCWVFLLKKIKNDHTFSAGKQCMYIHMKSCKWNIPQPRGKYTGS
jgi:hypothetical protein